MLYTELTKKALLISFNTHKDQVDKSGMPYVYHPYHIAEQMDDEYTTCVALLHDVVEDTDITIDDLKEQGFPTEVIDALSLMTHNESVDYFDYIRALKDNSIARTVKMADLIHNSNLSRLDVIDYEALERNEKYKKALSILIRAEKQSRMKQIDALRMKCCGITVPDSFQFCPECGQEIVDVEKTQMAIDLDQTFTFCRECGKTLLLYKQYCGYCGKPIHSRKL